MNAKVLFLGMTNHCASRFAEIMFNHLAGEQLLSFYSFSRGIVVQNQPEPINPKTVTALTARGVLMTGNLRNPELLRTRDIQHSDYVVLISGSELAQCISHARGIEDKEIILWDFNNVSTLLPHELYPALEAEVYLLIRRLQQMSHLQTAQVTA
jgi:protein-tyrosine phosphatase